MSLAVHPAAAIVFSRGMTPVRVTAEGFGRLSLLGHRVRVDGHLDRIFLVPAGTTSFLVTFNGVRTLRARGRLTPTVALAEVQVPQGPRARVPSPCSILTPPRSGPGPEEEGLSPSPWQVRRVLGLFRVPAPLALRPDPQPLAVPVPASGLKPPPCPAPRSSDGR
jgi:hypothetical protein